MICDLCRAELKEGDVLRISSVPYHRSIKACVAVAMGRLKERIEGRAGKEADRVAIAAQEPAQQAQEGV
jgi:hypothetical protein